MKKLLITIFLLNLFASFLVAQERLSMNNGWSFKYFAPDDPQLPSLLMNYYYKNAQTRAFTWGWDELMQISYNDSVWRKINIPNDFVVESAPMQLTKETDHGWLERGVGMYRKIFDMPSADKGKRIWIRFDGVYRDAQVFVNGFKMIEHQSGYTPFRIVVSDVLHYGNKRNIILVVADSKQSEGWFYEGGGIYRPVFMEKSGGSLYFEPDGIAINPVLTSDYASANVEVCYDIQNRERKDRKFELTMRIVDQQGKEVKSFASAFNIEAWKSMDCKMNISLNSPRLWSLEERNLYFLESEIREDGQIIDKNNTRFGVRQIAFDAAKGFLLNGKHVKIMGACVHQDNGSVGAAVPSEIMRYRVQVMRDFGFNGYRVAHHAAAPELLDVCDEEGMLLMNEQRVAESNPKYLEEMREIIRTSRNHPSVIIYNLANEDGNIEATDFEGGLISTLMQEISRLDPQKRPATMGRVLKWHIDEKTMKFVTTNTLEEKLANAYCCAGRVVDVAGFNYSDDIMYAYDQKGQPLIQSETSSDGATRGIYTSDKTKIWSSSYPNWKTHDRIKQFMITDKISGSFPWTAFDYRGESRTFPGACSNFGVFDLCGFPKDAAYFYKAVQTTNPTLHLFPHWTWKGKEGQIIKVYTYTNVEEVELFQDGKSLGKQKVLPFQNQRWDVTYKPGTLIARGYIKGKVALTEKVVTAGDPYAVRTTSYKNNLKADGSDAVTVKFEIVDKKGIVCPDADNLVNISVSGNGNLLGVDNGNPSNINPAKLPKVRAFSGLCSAIVQSNDVPGSIIIKAESQGLLSGRLEINTKTAEINPSVKSDFSVKDFMFFRQPDSWKFQ
jgi:beta-galactosidase